MTQFPPRIDGRGPAFRHAERFPPERGEKRRASPDRGTNYRPTMDALKKIAAAAGALKLLPLPSVVLFPHTAVPLHIFEPRYRALVHDSLASDQVLALAVLQPGWERDYHGRPPTSAICCAGAITEHQELSDGRYLVIVEGQVRARVARELP